MLKVSWFKQIYLERSEVEFYATVWLSLTLLWEGYLLKSKAATDREVPEERFFKI